MQFNRKEPMGKWLSAIKNAKFVITDSFHAVVFSTIYNVPFVQVANAVNTQSRFESLFRLLGIENYSTNDLASIDSQKIIDIFNWEVVNNNINKEVQKAQDWMSKAMKKEKKELPSDRTHDLLSATLVQNAELNGKVTWLINRLNANKNELVLLGNKDKIMQKYRTYKIFSKITIGKARKKYKEKTLMYKEKVNTIRRISNGL